MDSHQEDLSSKLSQDELKLTTEKAEKSPFEIRLNNTYQALFRTEEPIAISLAEAFKNRMDDIIIRNEGREGVHIIRYVPELHLYHKNQAAVYFEELRKTHTTIRDALWPNYSLIKHPLPNNYRYNLNEQLRLLYPDELVIELEEGVFDILDYGDSSFELRYNEDSESRLDFILFFSIRLGTEPMGNLDDFLTFHIEYNFDGDTAKFARFLKVVCAEYKDTIFTPARIALIESWVPVIESSQSGEYVSVYPLETENRRSGPKAKKKIEIPIPPARTPNDGRTVLTVESTALLFRILQNMSILNEKGDDLSNESLAKAIQSITGYSPNSISESLGKAEIRDYSANAKRELKAQIKKISDFIINELSRKNPSNY